MHVSRVWGKRDLLRPQAPRAHVEPPALASVCDDVAAEIARVEERIRARDALYNVDGTGDVPQVDVARETVRGYDTLRTIRETIARADARTYAETGEHGFVPWHRELLEALAFVSLRIIFQADFDANLQALLRLANRTDAVRELAIIAGRRSGKTMTVLLWLAVLLACVDARKTLSVIFVHKKKTTAQQCAMQLESFLAEIDSSIRVAGTPDMQRLYRGTRIIATVQHTVLATKDVRPPPARPPTVSLRILVWCRDVERRHVANRASRADHVVRGRGRGPPAAGAVDRAQEPQGDGGAAVDAALVCKAARGADVLDRRVRVCGRAGRAVRARRGDRARRARGRRRGARHGARWPVAARADAAVAPAVIDHTTRRRFRFDASMMLIQHFARVCSNTSDARSPVDARAMRGRKRMHSPHTATRARSHPITVLARVSTPISHTSHFIAGLRSTQPQ